MSLHQCPSSVSKLLDVTRSVVMVACNKVCCHVNVCSIADLFDSMNFSCQGSINRVACIGTIRVQCFNWCPVFQLGCSVPTGVQCSNWCPVLCSDYFCLHLSSPVHPLPLHHSLSSTLLMRAARAWSHCF